MTNATAANTPQPNRQDVIRQFVAGHGWADATITPLREDTSVRRYFRLSRVGGNAILMDARPPMEDTQKFVYMAAKLRRLGFTVPDIYAADHTQGLVLMEDFGDNSFFVLISNQGQAPEPLLTLAVDVLIHKANADPAIALDACVAYSDEYWLHRVEEFLKFYQPHVAKQSVSDASRKSYLAVFKDLLDRAHKLPDVLLHGDYGLQNFMYLPDRPGIQALGLLDFQDMTDARGNMCGSPAFDLMFLLRDVRAHYAEEMIVKLTNRFIAGTNLNAKDMDQFEYECAAITAAQSAKCLGLFARFGVVNNRPEYLPFIDNCWRNLRWAFAHPGLADVKMWFENNGGIK